MSTLEQDIQAKGLTAPPITPAHIEAVIADELYFTAAAGVEGQLARGGITAEAIARAIPSNSPAELLTICVLTLRNGFTVTGTSACASPENFDAAVGRKAARANAVNQIWPLEVYLLKQKLFMGAHLTHLVDTDNRTIELERIAKACHEVNRAYCASLGDLSQPAWEDAPTWQRESAIAGVKFHLANPLAGPEASHNAWLEDKRASGWAYGPVKNAELLLHPCFLPFEQLPREQQAKDYLFRAVVHQMIAQ